MAKLEGKLPFTNAIYSVKTPGEGFGELVKVVSRERRVGGEIIIHVISQRNSKHKFDSRDFYNFFKRCKEGTPFHIEEGWNE